MSNKVENPHNGPSAKMVYAGGGIMVFIQNGYLVQPVNSYYMVIFPIMIVSCPGTAGALQPLNWIS